MNVNYFFSNTHVYGIFLIIHSVKSINYTKLKVRTAVTLSDIRNWTAYGFRRLYGHEDTSETSRFIYSSDKSDGCAQ